MKRTASQETGREPSPAERAGKMELYRHFREYHGCQAKLSRDTGIHIAVLSKMANQPEYIITLDAALLMEVATAGKLRAEVLCPSRADLLAAFLALRTPETAEA